MDLNAIRVFVKVVQAGSFVQAARQLEIPSSTVSAKISALEKRLGVTLLQRTTRKLHLTQVGATYFQHCIQALNEIQGAEAEIASAKQEPQGKIKVAAPVDLGNACLMGLASSFTKKFPQVDLEFSFSDRLVDLVAEGFDVAIRAGHLKDSGLMAKKLGTSYWVPFASPHYLKTMKPLLHPKDLLKHNCIQFTSFGENTWELSKGSTTVKISPKWKVGANDMNFTKSLCLKGDGIALLPTFSCHAEVKSGKLVRLLPDWVSRVDPVHIVYPEQKFVPAKTRAFIDTSIKEFESILIK